MAIVETPKDAFDLLPGYSFQPNFCEVASTEDGPLKMHYVDYGSITNPIVLLLHGEPTWSYLYRNMITAIAQHGFRVIAPDLIGFGKSSKLTRIEDYSYDKHIRWLEALVSALSMKDIILFCQDWGGLLGLRLVAAHQEKFRAVVAANTMLPTGDHEVPDAFLKWQNFARHDKEFNIGKIIQGATCTPLISEVVNAYNAPFPSEEYKAGARAFPLLVPTSPDNVESENNRIAWKNLSTFNKPFITAFSDSDPVTHGGDKVFQKLIPGAKDQPHQTLKGGGHFLQEDCANALSDIIINLGKSR